MKIALAGIVKNEASSLLEWIAYHKALGVDHFLIMDNGSDDGSWSLLKKLQRRGVVTAKRFRTLAGQPPQLDAYQKILKGRGSAFDVVIFLDADEYLMPMDGAESVRPAIENLFSDSRISAVVMNWACFGSSGQLFRESGLVPERFQRRAQQGHKVNRHYKTMVRPEMVVRFFNPHEAWVRSGRTVNTINENVEIDPDRPHGFTANLCWERLRVNHYVVKSMEEFLVRKSRVGSAARAGRTKHREFFEGHDRNEVGDDSVLRLLPIVKSQIERFEQILARPHGALERLGQTIQRISPYRSFLYVLFLVRRFRLYAFERFKHGPLSLKDRDH